MSSFSLRVAMVLLLSVRHVAAVADDVANRAEPSVAASPGGCACSLVVMVVRVGVVK